MQTLKLKTEVDQLKDLRDVVYIEAIGDFTNIYTTDGQKQLLHEKLNDVAKVLTSNKFFQIHDLFIINADYIKRIKGSLTKYVLLKDDLEVIISPKRYKFLVEFLRYKYSISL